MYYVRMYILNCILCTSNFNFRIQHTEIRKNCAAFVVQA